jgi:hypothetical protein
VSRVKVSELISVLRTSGASVKLDFRVGPFEVGAVWVSSAEAWHAEVPGTEGAAALSLLSELPACQVRFSAGEPEGRTIAAAHQPPLELVSDAVKREVAAARAAGQLIIGEGAVAPRHSVGALSLPPDVVPTSGEFSLATPRAERAATDAFEVTFRRGTQAYLRHDFKTALEAFEDCLRQRPGDRRVLHNLERLRNRTT